jgi:uncharacterized protein YodC (DUF2158 family)
MMNTFEVGDCVERFDTGDAGIVTERRDEDTWWVKWYKVDGRLAHPAVLQWVHESYISVVVSFTVGDRVRLCVDLQNRDAPAFESTGVVDDVDEDDDNLGLRVKWDDYRNPNNGLDTWWVSRKHVQLLEVL